MLFLVCFIYLAGSLPEDGSVKGSIVIGPDGEPISVGGHIDAHVRPDLLHHIENVGEANRHFGRGKSCHGNVLQSEL